MTESRSVVLNAVLASLASGSWVDGMRVLRDGMRAIPPHVASRHALGLRERQGAERERPIDELIESGRRSMARDSIFAALKRGRIVADVDEITREHWRGEKPFKLRDTEAGWMPIADLYEPLGITKAIAWNWIRNGFVPAPVQNAGGHSRVTPDQLTAWKLVREAWPGTGKRWAVDPRSLWERPTQVCPHCDQPIVITVLKA